MIDHQPLAIGREVWSSRTDPSLDQVSIGEGEVANLEPSCCIEDQSMFGELTPGKGLVGDKQIGRLNRQVLVQSEGDAGSNSLVDGSAHSPAKAQTSNQHQVTFFIQSLNQLCFVPELVVRTWRNYRALAPRHTHHHYTQEPARNYANHLVDDFFLKILPV